MSAAEAPPVPEFVILNTKHWFLYMPSSQPRVSPTHTDGIWWFTMPVHPITECVYLVNFVMRLDGKYSGWTVFTVKVTASNGKETTTKLAVNGGQPGRCKKIVEAWNKNIHGYKYEFMH
jgi:hypothetical protein